MSKPRNELKMGALGIVVLLGFAAGQRAQAEGDFPALACAKTALSQGLNRPQSALLCQEASDSTPVDCYFTARNELQTSALFLHDLSMEICQGATHLGPIDCAREALARGMPPARIQSLCKRARGPRAIQCIDEAVQAGFLLQWAQVLCSGARY